MAFRTRAVLKTDILKPDGKFETDISFFKRSFIWPGERKTRQ